MGIPRFGRDIGVREELAAPAPAPEVLGTVSGALLTDGPQGSSAVWASGDHTVELSEPPPPWEQAGGDELTASDAHRYVDVPDNWTLRWANPRLIETSGWGHWQAVLASSPLVKVKVPSMAKPDGTIRRGGDTGDLLVWMYTSWVASRRRLLAAETAKLTASAVDRQQRLKDEMNRGTFGPYVHLDDARHPAYTMADGRSMKD